MAFQFNRRLADGQLFKLGVAVQKSDGWVFIPHVAGRKPSRKRYPTMEICLPRWIGYPNSCESEAAR
jgi:hypothetical protein